MKVETFEITNKADQTSRVLQIQPKTMVITLASSLILLLLWISPPTDGSLIGEVSETTVLADGTASKPINSVITAEIVTTGGSYKLISTHTHDIHSFTQGLIFAADEESLVIESAGLYGKGDVRMVNYDTGEVLKKTPILDKYFAEGIHLTEDGVLYLLTWKERTCLAFDGATLEERRDLNFEYKTHTGEGWGITGDGQGKLYVR